MSSGQERNSHLQTFVPTLFPELLTKYVMDCKTKSSEDATFHETLTRVTN